VGRRGVDKKCGEEGRPGGVVREFDGGGMARATANGGEARLRQSGSPSARLMMARLKPCPSGCSLGLSGCGFSAAPPGMRAFRALGFWGVEILRVGILADSNQEAAESRWTAA